MADVIHPAYYNSKSGRDVIEVAMDFELNVFQFNALKYLVRAGRKEPDKILDDINKAEEYLERWKDYVKYVKKEGRK